MEALMKLLSKRMLTFFSFLKFRLSNISFFLNFLKKACLIQKGPKSYCNTKYRGSF
jgi:hypothetical protein